MSLTVDVRDEAGKLLGTLPVDRADFWAMGDHTRFALPVQFEVGSWDGPDHSLRLEEAVLRHRRWFPGGAARGDWCFMVPNSELAKVERIPGFKPTWQSFMSVT